MKSKEESNDPIVIEEQLVERLRGRDQRALELLYDRYSPALFGVISRIVKQDAIAEDVLQECFMKIWRGFDSYDAERGRLFTWLVRIARNLALDRLKSRDYRELEQNRSLDEVVHLQDEGTGADRGVDAIGMDRLLSSLTSEQRAIIDLIYFQGYTQSEAAEELGIPIGTVKTRARAALLLLRGVLSTSSSVS